MKKQILILTVVIFAIIGLFLISRNSSSNSGTLFEVETSKSDADEIDYEDEIKAAGIKTAEIEQHLDGTIFVDVQGEVVNPGVFEVEYDVRVGYLIDLAGGLTDYASMRGLNQAARIYDEMVILVPHVDDIACEVIELDSSSAESASNDESSLISLSTASASELQSLPGIGPALSANIIAHREENGAFSTIDELVNVAGIGVATLENIRDFVKP